MDLQLQSMDQFPSQLSIFLMVFRSIPSPKKFILQKIMEEEISEDGIEHLKLLELLLAWDWDQHFHFYILISKMMELYLLPHMDMHYTNFLQMVKNKK